jgi:hypothetical protein
MFSPGPGQAILVDRIVLEFLAQKIGDDGSQHAARKELGILIISNWR